MASNPSDSLMLCLIEKKKRFSRRLSVPLFLAVAIGALYLDATHHQFTNWDDGMVYENPQIRQLDWKGIKRIFTPEKGHTFQPVRVLSYAVDYHFWGLNPLGYKITNILLYIFTCIMVFWLLTLLSERLRPGLSQDSHRRVATFGAFLFAVHPVHVEAVTWISARKEVLQGFFLFSSLYLYIKARESAGTRKVCLLGLGLFALVAAVLSKPSAVVFPAILIIYELSIHENECLAFLKKHWLFFLSVMAVSIIFAWILIEVMFEAGGIKPYRGGSFLANFLLSFYVFVRNIKLLLFTTEYSPAYDSGFPDPIKSPYVLLSVVATVALIVFGVWSFRKRRTIFFSIFFFVVTLSPYLNILPISTLVADRYLFIASFSYALLVGILLQRFYELRHPRCSPQFFKVLCIVVFFWLAGIHSLMTVEQNKVWENSYTLWADAVQKNPNSNTANALMGVVYMELGMNEKALNHLEKALSILPYDYESRNNLGIVYMRLGQPDRSLQEYMKALYLKPDSFAVRVNLSLLYARQGEFKKSEAILNNLISEQPENAMLHYRLGLLYKEMGSYKKAVEAISRSIELAPDVITPYEEAGNICINYLNDAVTGKVFYTMGVKACAKATRRVEMLRWMINDLER